MGDVVKSGNLFKFSDTVFNSKWKYNYVELLRNSTLRWFENKSERTPKRSVVLKDVSSFLAFGDVVKQLPFKPEVKEEQISLLIAIPHEGNRNTRLTFFLCNNQNEMQEWVNSILSTITNQNNTQQTMSQIPTNAPPNPYPAGSNQPISGPSGNYQVGPPNAGTPYSGGPPNAGAYYPGGAPNTMGSNPVGQNNPMPPYQGAPPPYYSGPSSGPPPIGFNTGAPMPSSYPQAPQNYSYPQNSTYQAGYNKPYPVQQGQYAPAQQGQYAPAQQGQYAPAQQGQYAPVQVPTYMPGNPSAMYGGPPGVVQPNQTYVIVDGKKKKKKFKLKNAAIGLAAGAAGAYATHKLFHGYGHGWGGGWGGHHGYGGGWGGHHDHWGSWSSLSSFDSFGSWSD